MEFTASAVSLNPEPDNSIDDDAAPLLGDKGGMGDGGSPGL